MRRSWTRRWRLPRRRRRALAPPERASEHVLLDQGARWGLDRASRHGLPGPRQPWEQVLARRRGSPWPWRRARHLRSPGPEALGVVLVVWWELHQFVHGHQSVSTSLSTRRGVDGGFASSTSALGASCAGCGGSSCGGLVACVLPLSSVPGGSSTRDRDVDVRRASRPAASNHY